MGENDRKLAISDDELKALTTVLGTLSLLPKSEEQAAGTKSAIEDFTLNITTSTQKLIKTITGTGAAAGSVATITAWLKDQNDLVLASSLLSTALVLAVGLFSLAKVMDGDVRGRASAATAAVEARGLVARALIDIYGSAATQGAAGKGAGPGKPTADEATRPSDLQTMLALAAFHRHLKVSTKQGESTVDGARWTSEDQLEIKLSNGDWVKADKVAEFSGEVEEPRSR